MDDMSISLRSYYGNKDDENSFFLWYRKVFKLNSKKKNTYVRNTCGTNLIWILFKLKKKFLR